MQTLSQVALALLFRPGRIRKDRMRNKVRKEGRGVGRSGRKREERKRSLVTSTIFTQPHVMYNSPQGFQSCFLFPSPLNRSEAVPGQRSLLPCELQARVYPANQSKTKRYDVSGMIFSHGWGGKSGNTPVDAEEGQGNRISSPLLKIGAMFCYKFYEPSSYDTS